MTPADSRKAFDGAARQRILTDSAVVLSALDELGHLAVGADPAFRNRLLVHCELYTEYSVSLREEYARGVPVLPISRCPLTNEVLHHSIDTLGPDGLWWDYESPCRPPESVPVSFVGLTGALRPSGPIEYSPFLVRPGPSVPFVIPRILEAGAVAVLSTVPVGAHTGFSVAYFSQAGVDTTLFNEWGANSYRRYVRGEAVSWDAAADADAMDFDLAPWLDRRLLGWIAPGDPDLTVRHGIEGCPYLDLPGSRAAQRIQYGTVWTSAAATRRGSA